jgi:hypothetical protein
VLRLIWPGPTARAVGADLDQIPRLPSTSRPRRDVFARPTLLIGAVERGFTDEGGSPAGSSGPCIARTSRDLPYFRRS